MQLVLVGLFSVYLVMLVHELGHLTIARAYGVEIAELSLGLGPTLLRWQDRRGTFWSLRLVPLGGSCAYSSEALNRASAVHQAIIVIGGPMFNIVLAAVFYCVYWLTNFDALEHSVDVILSLAIANCSLVVALSNLLPIPPLDGGRILGIFLKGRQS